MHKAALENTQNPSIDLRNYGHC